MKLSDRIDFDGIARLALMNAEQIVGRWLPDGRRQGAEWVALNPTRLDTRPGSFKVNLINGRWADFAAGAKGGDLISLAAYLYNIKQVEAARQVAKMLGV